jgi:hypothetical protein
MKKLSVLLLFVSTITIAQTGTWTPLVNQSNNNNAGLMLLLSDGSVIVPTFPNGFVGNTWQKLTPDSAGSYVKGTWTDIAPMNDSRLDFGSQVLMDGRVFVAGGEYGSGKVSAEIYDPVLDTWTYTPTPVLHDVDSLMDCNTEILPDGRILISVAKVGTVYNGDSTVIYNPVSNTYIQGPNCLQLHDESTWVKLADGSILMPDDNGFTLTSERFIPSLNTWVADNNGPAPLFGLNDNEIGGGLLLPDGRAFILGGSGKTAYYIPSGNNTAGSWTAGPDIPMGCGAIDATASMMPNGKILCAVSPKSLPSIEYRDTTIYFEFDYTNNMFTQISRPEGGGDTTIIPCYTTNSLNLPDGNILFCERSSQYYVYTPFGSPLISGKPTVSNVKMIGCNSYQAFGTLFNGISEGSSYGDDAQMSTNYPIIQLKNNGNVYYARTHHWNSTGLQRGALVDSVFFEVPANLPNAIYSLSVIANGIPSAPYSFAFAGCITGIKEKEQQNAIYLYPNPASETVQIKNPGSDSGIVTIFNCMGKMVLQQNITPYSIQIDVSGLANGLYSVELRGNKSTRLQKLVIAK